MTPLYYISYSGEQSWAIKSSAGFLLLQGDLFLAGLSGLIKTDKLIPENEAVLLPPCGSSKVLGLAFNYKSLTGEHAIQQEPLFFYKSVTGLIGSGHAVTIPSFVEKVWVEVELALVIGKRGSNILPKQVADHVLGYTIGNDITASNLYGRDHHLARSKGLDGFCPLGPALFLGMPPSNLQIRTTINGNVTQQGSTNDRILGDIESVALLSKYVTLEPGDVILTGTCAGAMESLVVPGDEVELSIEGLGVLVTRFI